jgi:DMSO/TMAO reductase YedYZ molybdopterin-dependent catalytic subunit
VPRRRLLGVLAGLLAAAAGLGAAEGLAAVLSAPSPVVAVGTWAIDTAPTWLREFAIRHFGADDKNVLVVGVLSTVAVLSAGAGALGVSARRAAVSLTVAVGAVALLAGVTVRGAHGSPLVRAVPALAALLASAGSLYWLLNSLRLVPAPAPEAADAQTAWFGPAVVEDGSRPSTPVRATLAVRERAERAAEPARPERPAEPARPERPAVIIPGRRLEPIDRRSFVRAAGSVGAIAIVGGVLREVEVGNRLGVPARLPAPTSAAALVRNADFGLPGLSPYFTPNAGFYRVDTSIEVPLLDARSWHLRIDGMVENPLTISYADLTGRSLIERDVTLTCVSNEIGGDLIGNARWLGLPIRDLLLAARPKPGADAVRSQSVDGWTAGTPLSALIDPGRDAMLAIGMNGVPLSAEHGYPVRMVVPGLYGFVSATKWVTRLEVTRFDAFEAYWTKRGWSAQAPIKTESRLELPRPYAEIKPGPTTVAGVAWAQHRGISKVEVQIDDQPWRQATLTPWRNADTWRQWRLDWAATAGTHNLSVRATDGTGAVQTAQNAEPIPNGASGYHSVLSQVIA